MAARVSRREKIAPPANPCGTSAVTRSAISRCRIGWSDATIPIICSRCVMSSDTLPYSPRILLCDDSPVERLALAHFLRGVGFTVDEAGDGESAILHVKHRQVDVLLLDLHMPDVDGFE